MRKQFVPELLPYFEISSPYSKGHEQDQYEKLEVKISLFHHSVPTE